MAIVTYRGLLFSITACSNTNWIWALGYKPGSEASRAPFKVWTASSSFLEVAPYSVENHTLELFTSQFVSCQRVQTNPTVVLVPLELRGFSQMPVDCSEHINRHRRFFQARKYTLAPSLHRLRNWNYPWMGMYSSKVKNTLQSYSILLPGSRKGFITVNHFRLMAGKHLIRDKVLKDLKVTYPDSREEKKKKNFCVTTNSVYSQTQKLFDKAKGERMWFPVSSTYTEWWKKWICSVPHLFPLGLHCLLPQFHRRHRDWEKFIPLHRMRFHFSVGQIWYINVSPPALTPSVGLHRSAPPIGALRLLLRRPPQSHCPILPVPAKGTFILQIPHPFQKAVSRRAVTQLLGWWTCLASNWNRDLFLFLLCGTKNTVFLFQSNFKCFLSLQGALFCFQLI